VKFFLHISKEEQARRLQSRLDDPSKRWKFNSGDLVERKLWDHYQLAYQEAISQTSTEHAPWYVIPSDRKWYRNWAIAQVIAETLDRMDPQYPEPEELDPNLQIV
jgi:polyphosphate kinase 2 (PPK2 family)